MKRTIGIPILLGVVLLTATGACTRGVEMSGSQYSMQDGFSWVVNNKLAGMPRPGGEEDIAFLQHQDIRLLVSLTEISAPADLLDTAGISLLHLPVMDFQAPSVAQLESFVGAASASMANGKAVGVHCAAGKGRTGTFLAAYFISTGMTAQEAIDHVRSLRPGSIETPAQEQVLQTYADNLTTK